MSRRFTLQLLTIWAALMGLGMTAGYLLDPFQIYHASFFARDRYLENSRYQNAGLINRLWTDDACCDMAIFGTSMSQNFSPRLAAQVFGRKGALKVTMSGATPAEIDRTFAYLAMRGAPEIVLLDIHRAYGDARQSVINGPDMAEKRPDKFFPSYLYNDILLDDLPYLANAALIEYAQKLVTDGKAHENLQSWYAETKNAFGKEEKRLRKAPAVSRKTSLYADRSPFPNIDGILAPRIALHPDIRFRLFFPPYSRHYYAAMPDAEFNRLMALRKAVVEKLSSFPNVEIYAFDLVFEEPGSLAHYKDLGHYSLAVSEKILTAIAKGEGRLTHETIDAHIAGVTDAVNAYAARIASRKPGGSRHER
jgi:hypothetical protein